MSWSKKCSYLTTLAWDMRCLTDTQYQISKLFNLHILASFSLSISTKGRRTLWHTLCMSFLQNEWKSNATPDGNNGILSCLRSVVRGKSNKCVTIEPLHSCAKGTLQTLSYFLCTYIAHTFLET